MLSSNMALDMHVLTFSLGLSTEGVEMPELQISGTSIGYIAIF